MYKLGLIAVLFFGLAAGRSWGATAPSVPPNPAPASEPNAVETVLKNLQDRAAELKSYQVNIDYVFKQPLLDSQQWRTGVLSYARFGDKSDLRIDFQTLQQDDEKPQKYVQQYLFNGVWLLEVDHQLKTATRRQLTEPDQPLDAFSLASRHVPVLGFSKVEDLRRQFEITLVSEPPAEPAPRPHLHLKVKPDSVYRDDYVTIDFWIDPQVGLPAEVKAVTPEDDVYEIRLTGPKVNTALEPKLFQIEVPRGFSSQVIPLAKQTAGPPKR
jgi:outer membrane lipoprotein-sorting protein